MVHLYGNAMNFQTFYNKYHYIYSIELYISITMSTSLALSIRVLFISLMQLVTGAQFLIIIFFLLFASAPAAAVFWILIVALTRIYA